MRAQFVIPVLVSILILGGLGFSDAYAASFTTLGDLTGGFFFSSASGTSSDGSVVVGQGSSASGFEAFRWTSGGGMVGLGDLAGGGFLSQSFGTSSDGSVVVGQGISASGFEAFIWDSTNGMQSLNTVLTNAGVDLTGYTLNAATGVSDDGTKIVGLASGPSGPEAFLVELTLLPLDDDDDDDNDDDNDDDDDDDDDEDDDDDDDDDDDEDEDD